MESIENQINMKSFEGVSDHPHPREPKVVGWSWFRPKNFKPHPPSPKKLFLGGRGGLWTTLHLATQGVTPLPPTYPMGGGRGVRSFISGNQELFHRICSSVWCWPHFELESQNDCYSNYWLVACWLHVDACVGMFKRYLKLLSQFSSLFSTLDTTTTIPRCRILFQIILGRVDNLHQNVCIAKLIASSILTHNICESYTTPSPYSTFLEKSFDIHVERSPKTRSIKRFSFANPRCFGTCFTRSSGTEWMKREIDEVKNTTYV